MTKHEIDERRWRQLVLSVALILVVVGLVFSVAVFTELTSRTIIDATVESVVQDQGKCRRPSGRYQECVHSRVGVSFLPSPGAPIVHATLLVTERDASFSPGDIMKVAFKASNPADVVHPDFARTLRTPFGLLFIGLFVIFMERMTRQSSQ